MLTPTLEDGLKRYAIGQKLRALRLRKKMGLVELGQHTGLSPALLSKLERDRLFPTLPTLLRISMVFDVGLEYFFAGAREKPVCEVVRKKERLSFPDSENGSDSQFQFQSLDYPAQERKLNAYLAEFFSVTPDKTSNHEHPGVEFIYVIQGVLTVSINDTEHRLATGDSMYFDSTVPHGYRRSGKARCEAVVVTTT